DPQCGVRKGMTLAVYDAAGQYDMFSVTDAVSTAIQVQRTTANPTFVDYEPGRATVAEGKSVVYYLKSDAAGETFRLMAQAGRGNDGPVVDHLVALAFEYYGDPNPPSLIGQLTVPPEAGVPRTTYGPAPPALDEQIPTQGYAPGENCTFVVERPEDL